MLALTLLLINWLARPLPAPIFHLGPSGTFQTWKVKIPEFMLACCPEVWGNLVILTLRSIHLRPLHRGNGQPAAMGKGGSLGLHTLAQDPRGLDCGRQKPAHSRLWCGHLPHPQPLPGWGAGKP